MNLEESIKVKALLELAKRKPYRAMELVENFQNKKSLYLKIAQNAAMRFPEATIKIVEEKFFVDEDWCCTCVVVMV